MSGGLDSLSRLHVFTREYFIRFTESRVVVIFHSVRGPHRPPCCWQPESELLVVNRAGEQQSAVAFLATRTGPVTWSRAEKGGGRRMSKPKAICEVATP